jgi:NAD(P)H-dependent flavin oxidoreductase YrpB (nitropropane dioxygenase family)
VPDLTTARYLGAAMTDVIVTTEVDGMPQRVVGNELVQRLESGTGLAKLIGALRSGLAYRKLSGASIAELIRSAFAMRRNERLTRSQMLMAANAPMLARKAMREGDPVNGYLPGGTVAGVIDDRPSCAELIERIVSEAETTLKALSP